MCLYLYMNACYVLSTHRSSYYVCMHLHEQTINTVLCKMPYNRQYIMFKSPPLPCSILCVFVWHKIVTISYTGGWLYCFQMFKIDEIVLVTTEWTFMRCIYYYYIHNYIYCFKIQRSVKPQLILYNWVILFITL